MNAKELYLTIGQIDDDLILGANGKRSKKNKSAIYRWLVAAAACICLVFGGGYLHFFGTVAVWNTGVTEYVAKFSIPENSTVQKLSRETISDYYHIALSDMLGDLSRIPADVWLYMDADGRVLYDRNVFRYENADGSKGINLTLSRVSSVAKNDGEKVSRIHGTSVILTEDTTIPDYLLLSAQWEQDGTTVHLAAEGLTQGELVTILKELI